MIEPVAHFEIGYTRCLDPAGKTVAELPEFARDPSKLVKLYQALTRTRAFDARAIALQRTGRLGTFASSLGQEAVSVGTADAMQPADVLVPSFREHGAQLMRGVTPSELFLYWGGDERGSAYAGPREDFPLCVPVGSHAPHAAGIALAFKLRHERRVAVCMFGDGATSKGDVAEALNMAGLWRLPVVFVVSNNQWAISVPRQRQTAAATLAQKAIAAGMTGEQVDGNDVVAVRFVVGTAIERARGGAGPSLIEAVTYRLGDHTTADDASRYRDDTEVSRHWPEEPLLRLRNYLVVAGHWSREQEEHLLQETAREMDAAAEQYLATPPQECETIFDYTFARLPADLAAQRESALAAKHAAESSRPPGGAAQ
ncbi:MAG TPA: pyruvate dehydrogenase (acetyl-transferring) E1 component subunit alpha [Stellaceae bacterium]|nr:pyruvate dehydrogenase (acetyl-transferring) E1 component subunit alpha [Stellaceae bacterium]